MNKEQLAENYFKQGYNCAQAVVLAFMDEIKLDKQTLSKMSISFGGGIGRLREVCGAVSGMCMVLGLLSQNNEPDIELKKQHYALVQKLVKQFEQENGNIICRNLLDGNTAKDTAPENTTRTPEFYKKRPCVEYVKCACRLLNEHFSSQK